MVLVDDSKETPVPSALPGLSPAATQEHWGAHVADRISTRIPRPWVFWPMDHSLTPMVTTFGASGGVLKRSRDDDV